MLVNSFLFRVRVRVRVRVNDAKTPTGIDN
jgi:hypothetical protein